MSSFIRKDLRDYNQLRPFSINIGGLSEYDGSCQFSQGNSTVLTTVQGPGQPRFSRHDNVEKLSIDIEVNIPNKINPSTIGTNSISSSTLNSSSLKNEEFVENYLLTILNNCINIHLYKKKLLIVKILILQDNGSILSTILNSVTLALLDSGIELNYFPISFDLSLLNPSYNSSWLIDPSIEEDLDSECLISCTVISTNSFFKDYNNQPNDKLEEDNKKDVQFIKFELFGSCSDVLLLDSAMKLVEGVVENVENIFRDTLNKKSLTNNI